MAVVGVEIAVAVVDLPGVGVWVIARSASVGWTLSPVSGRIQDAMFII